MNPRVHAYGYCVGDETWSFNIVFTNIVRTMIQEGYDISIQNCTQDLILYKKEFKPYKKIKGWAFSCGHPDTINIMPMEKRSYYCYWGEHKIKPEHVTKINTLDVVFVNSSFSKRLLLESGVRTRIELMYPGFSPNLHFPTTLAHEKDRKKFLFVGQQWRRKGLDVLAKAWESFSGDSSLSLTVKLSPSNESDFPIVKEFFSKSLNVTVMMESLTKEGLADLYRAHDFFIFPSRSEGFGVPVLEALACGLLPIVTNYGGYMDFCNPENAILVPVKNIVPRDDGMDVGEWADIDPDALIAGIRKALTVNVDDKKKERSASVSKFTYVQTVTDMKAIFV